MRVYLLLCHLSVIYAVFFFYFLQFCGTRFSKYHRVIFEIFKASLYIATSEEYVSGSRFGNQSFFALRSVNYARF